MTYDNTTTSQLFAAPDLNPLADQWYTESPVKLDGTPVPYCKVNNTDILHKYTVRNGDRVFKYDDNRQPYGTSPITVESYTLPTSAQYTLQYLPSSSGSTLWKSSVSSTRDEDGNLYGGADRDYYGTLGISWQVYQMSVVGTPSYMPATMYYTVFTLFGKPMGYSKAEEIAQYIQQGTQHPTTAEWNSALGYYLSYNFMLAYTATTRVFSFTSFNIPNFSSLQQKFTFAQIKSVIGAASPVYSLKIVPYAYSVSGSNPAEITVTGSTDGSNDATVTAAGVLRVSTSCLHSPWYSNRWSDGVLPGLCYSACISSYHYNTSAPVHSAFGGMNVVSGSSCDVLNTYPYRLQDSFSLSTGETLESCFGRSACYNVFANGTVVTVQWVRTGNSAARASSAYIKETDNNAVVRKEY